MRTIKIPATKRIDVQAIADYRLKVTSQQIGKHAELWAKFNGTPYPWDEVRREVQFVPIALAEAITFTTGSPHRQQGQGGVFFYVEPSGRAHS